MYCSKCGKEMPDDAVICTGCGCLLNQRKVNTFLQNEEKTFFEGRQIPQKQEKIFAESIEEVQKKTSQTAFWYLVVTSICLSFTVLSLLLALSSLSFYSLNGLYRAGDVLLWIEPAKLVCSLIFSALSLIAGILAFIFSLRKGTDKSLKLFSIFTLGMSVALTLGILKLCTAFAW